MPFVTKSALSKILDHVEKEGVPQLHSRKHMAESTAKFLSKACAYGPIFLSKKLFNSDGSTCEVKILNFWSFLDFAFQSGGSLYKLLSSVTASAGLILYTDEIVVGNPLAHKPRKLWAVYCACQPFGVHLQDDNSWVTLAIVKSSVVQKLDGQLSQLMKEILLSIFFSGACEPLHFGVQLSNPAPLTGKRKMQFHLAYIIQDGGAHKYFWNIKGDGGSRYCIKCRNVLLGGMKTVWTQSQHTPKCLTCPSQPKMRFLILGTDLRKGKGNAMPQPSGSGNKPLAFAGVNTAFWDAKS